MTKKICFCLCSGLIIIIVLNALTGCIGYTTDQDPSWTNRFEHEKRHFRAFWQDMSEIHRFLDRHLFNFDETDPTRY